MDGTRVVFYSRTYIFTSISCNKMGKHNKEKGKNFKNKRKKSQELKKLKNKNRSDLQKKEMSSQTETSVNTTPTNSTPSTCSTSTVKSPFHLSSTDNLFSKQTGNTLKPVRSFSWDLAESTDPLLVRWHELKMLIRRLKTIRNQKF